MNLNEQTIKKSLEGLKKKEFSSLELTKACLRQIKNQELKINAFVSITEEKAIEQAKKADLLISKGTNSPLIGVPVSIKDNFCTKNIRTTASSKVLDDFIPPFNATVVKLLEEAGIVMLGKTNLDAWAHGSSTETSDFGSTKNPWNTNFLPGGSSGGAAASVASNETVFAIGSETAGSIRQPASWCGVVGLKPTYGRVSRYGLIAMVSSLDCPGPIAKSVEDCALVLEVLAGKDSLDATTSDRAVPKYSKSLNNSLAGIRIGVSDEYFDGVDEEVNEKIQEAVKILEKLGAKIKKVKLFPPKYAIAVYTILQRSEVSSNLARYDGIRYGKDRSYFGEEAKRRIMLGTYTLSSGYYDQYYNKAQKVRTIIMNDFDKAFKKVDLIVGPTSPSTALPIGSSKNHPMFGEMSDALVEPSTIAGLAGINVPCGFSKQRLPIGLQIFGPQFSEERVLNAAHKYEQTTDWRKYKPSL